MKKGDQLTIKHFLKENNLNLVALSVFLLVTITLSSHTGTFSRQLGVLSAGISYFLMIDLIKKETSKEKLTLILMNFFILFFTFVFCIWVIFNLIIPFQGKYDWIILILWLIFAIGVPIKTIIS